MAVRDAGAHHMASLVQAAQLAVPDDVPGLLVRHAKGLGAEDAALYLVDYEQREIGLPLGIGGEATVAEEWLEPADQVLFFTDGVVEARSPDGQFFGVERLVDMVSRTSASATPAPETMRRLLHAILDHQDGELQDDATIVVVEWQGPGGALLEP